MSGCRGFTLIELLVAIAVLALLVLFLASASNQISQVWIRGEADNQYRIKANALLDFMGNEIKLAMVPISQFNSTTDPAPSLQFLISPATATVPSSYANRDTIFFQAPVASDKSQGDLAEVGYLVEWNGTTPSLCRLLVNPSDLETNATAGTSASDYLIYQSPLTWLTQINTATGKTVLGDKINPTSSNHYQGVFLNNVIGLWIQAYDAAGNALTSPFDSRSAGNASHPLPATVEVAVVVLDDATMRRMNATSQATIQSNYGTASSYTGSNIAAQEAAAFIKSLPSGLSGGAEVASIKVGLNNYR